MASTGLSNLKIFHFVLYDFSDSDCQLFHHKLSKIGVRYSNYKFKCTTNSLEWLFYYLDLRRPYHYCHPWSHRFLFGVLLSCACASIPSELAHENFQYPPNTQFNTQLGVLIENPPKPLK